MQTKMKRDKVILDLGRAQNINGALKMRLRTAAARASAVKVIWKLNVVMMTLPKRTLAIFLALYLFRLDLLLLPGPAAASS